MHEWNFTPDHPITLTLAADSRLNPTDYVDDQIWELNLGNSEPPAISLQTTFGLRARSCRIFPRFSLNDKTINNPSQFFRPITIHHFLPNYIQLSFKPFSAINVVLEYWVPDSHSIGCRARITNTTREGILLAIDWAEILIPSEDGDRMVINEIGLATVLSGRTANLAPVLFLTGGALPGKSPYPSLNLSLKIPPRAEQVIQWAHASLPDANTSFEFTKSILNKNWDTEFARIYRVNSQRMEISTGDHDWDTAFYLAQTTADQLLLNSPQPDISPSYVNSRNPDQGYSLLKNGSDYNLLWNGQTVMGAYYLTNFLLPRSPELMNGLLQNFFDTQTTEGEIDLKPGLGGQRSQLLATPLLAQLVWEYFQFTGCGDYLQTIFPKLISFFYSWFSEVHDRDHDTYPEWDQPAQTGFEENPIFSDAIEGSYRLDISAVESPDLCAYLYCECLALIAIAEEIGHQEPIPKLKEIANDLKTVLEQTWDDKLASYLYRDRDAHVFTSPVILGKRTGSGLIEIQSELKNPTRPVIRIDSQPEGTRPAQIYIHGTSLSGAHRVEHIPATQIHWHLSTGYVTSRYSYSAIEQIEAIGISPNDEITINASGILGLDQTLLMPLWAGIPSSDKAKIIVNLTIMNKKRFLGPFGLRSWVDFPVTPGLAKEITSVHLPMLSLITKGLLKYGERTKAAELFNRLMKAVIPSLKRDMSFHQFYHSETGKPFGAVNCLTSIVPIGLFLEILGIKIINPYKIEITGGNPFPWPVTIKYEGLTVIQQDKKALVIFPDGQNITIDNHQSQVITSARTM